MAEQLDLVAILWSDASADSEWSDGQSKIVVQHNVEIGLLWTWNDEALIITSGVGINKSISNRMTIPWVNVKEIRVLMPHARIKRHYIQMLGPYLNKP